MAKKKTSKRAASDSPRSAENRRKAAEANSAQRCRAALAEVSSTPADTDAIAKFAGLDPKETSAHMAMMHKRGHVARTGKLWRLTPTGIDLLLGLRKPGQRKKGKGKR